MIHKRTGKVSSTSIPFWITVSCSGTSSACQMILIQVQNSVGMYEHGNDGRLVGEECH